MVNGDSEIFGLVGPENMLVLDFDVLFGAFSPWFEVDSYCFSCI